MEIRLNLILIAALAFIWTVLSASTPRPDLDPDAASTRNLASLEDRFARAPSDLHLARELSTRYLEIEKPGLAIAAIRAGDARLLEDPMLAHRLAQAYEQSGRVLDALATADLALARCARSLGVDEAPLATPVPRYGCNERAYASLEVHRKALEHMVRWGVSEPRGDERVRVAYELALRRARVAAY